MAGTVSYIKSFVFFTFFAGHHVTGLGRAFCMTEVVLHPRQSLDSSSRGTTLAMKKPAYGKQSFA